MTEQPSQVTASGPGAVGVGGNVHGGVNTTVNNNYAGRQAVSWPHRVGVVPPLAQGFQVRAESEMLRRALSEGAAGTAAPTQVLSGMGGIGKTALAASYAHERWQVKGVDLLVWVSASSRDAVLTVYAQAAHDLVGPPPDETLEQKAGRFLTWLTTTDRRWLLVLDDLANPGHLVGLWPTGPAGQVLVTTRRRDASLTARGRTVVDIRLFTDEEARAYLTERLDRHRTRSERLTEADELIADLDRLPLALAQAASYMLDRDLTCAQYRQRLAKRRLELVFPADAPADEYAQTVAVAWSLSLEVASDLPPRGLALPVMSMASVLSPNGIPTDLFSAPAALAFLTQVNIVETASEEPVDRDDVHDTLSNLHRLSLLSRAETVRVHALVQRATLEQLDDDLADSAGRAAADALV